MHLPRLSYFADKLQHLCDFSWVLLAQSFTDIVCVDVRIWCGFRKLHVEHWVASCANSSQRNWNWELLPKGVLELNFIWLSLSDFLVVSWLTESLAICEFTWEFCYCCGGVGFRRFAGDYLVGLLVVFYSLTILLWSFFWLVITVRHVFI